MINICLIVLNYRDFKTTSKFIDTVKNYSNLDKIVVVDNNSNDRSYEKLKKFENHKIHVIKSNKNGGYGYGNNIGIKYAISEFNPNYLIISNPDVFFEDNILLKMVNVYSNNEKVGIVAPKMIDNSGQKSAWKLPTIVDDILLASSITSKTIYKIFKQKEYSLDKNINYVDVISGSFFMIPSNVMKSINYFDEDTFLYCEERILAFKLIKEGYKNIILGNISFIHEHSISIKQSISSKIERFKIYNDSKLVYYNKYYRLSKAKYNILKFVLNIGLVERKLIYRILDKF